MNTLLTDSQVKQLLSLRQARAASLGTALGPYDDSPFFNNMVLGRLQSMRFADSKVLRAGSPRPGRGRTSGQQTVYWLTPAGLTRADELAREARR